MRRAWPLLAVVQLLATATILGEQTQEDKAFEEKLASVVPS